MIFYDPSGDCISEDIKSIAYTDCWISMHSKLGLSEAYL